MPTGATAKWMTGAKPLCIVIVLCCLAWFFVFNVVRPRLILRNRLHQAMGIGVACKLYAAAHHGRYPEQLQQLVPGYFPDAGFLVFRSGDGSRQLDCEYFGGTDTGPADALLLRVSSDKQSGAVVIVRADLSGDIQKPANGR